MRLPHIYVPLPDTDETLHSLLIATFRLSGQPNFRGFSKLIFNVPTDGRGWSWCFNSLRKYLDPCRTTASALLQNTLLLPFITPFMSPETAKRNVNRLDGDYASGSDGRKPSWDIRNRRPLHYCPICVNNCLKRTGRSAWLRAHQLEGVQVCWKHGVCLISAFQVPLFPKLPHEFDNQQIRYSFNKADIWLARQARELLLANHGPSLPEHRRVVYRTQAALVGYGSPARIDARLIASHILEKFGQQFLHRLLGRADLQGLTLMVHRTISGRDTCLRPSIHLLCIDAIFGEQRFFFQKLRTFTAEKSAFVLANEGLEKEREECHVHRRIFLLELKVHGREVMLHLDRCHPLTHAWILKNALMWSRRRIAQLVPEGPDRAATLRAEARLQSFLGNSIRDGRRRAMMGARREAGMWGTGSSASRAAEYAFELLIKHLRSF